MVLMCPNHHTEIDNKALEGTYTVARVQQMKEEHESRFRRALVSLERIVDGTAGVVVKRPENMRALPGFDNMDEEETRDNLGGCGSVRRRAVEVAAVATRCDHPDPRARASQSNAWPVRWPAGGCVSCEDGGRCSDPCR